MDEFTHTPRILHKYCQCGLILHGLLSWPEGPRSYDVVTIGAVQVAVHVSMAPSKMYDNIRRLEWNTIGGEQ